MPKRNAVFIFVGIVVVVALWLASRSEPKPEPAADLDQEDAPSPPTPSRPLSALIDKGAAGAQAVRSAIAAGEEKSHEFRDQIVFAAAHLTDEELIAALELVVSPNYAIESLCLDDAFPLERRIALLTHFVELHESEEESEGMSDALQSTAYLFAQSDPAAAREWLRIFEPGIGPGQGLTAIFERLEASDPAAALAMLCDLDDREAESLIDYGSGPKRKHLSGREFAALVDTFKSGRLREFHLRQTVVWFIAEDDPEDALAYIRDLPADQRCASHGRQLVQAWLRRADSDIAEVLQRIPTDLPTEVQSPETYYVLAEAWQASDQPALLNWIDTLANGDIRDAAIRGYARNSVFREPAAAYELAVTMTDPAQRQQTVGWAMRNWLKADPAAASAALPAADIGTGHREEFERTLKQIAKDRSAEMP